ncbi:MAG: molybdopterin-binding protein, partial [Pseudomonadota bacterium]
MTGGDAGGGRLPDDCFALPPGVEWTPVDQALQRLRASLVPVTGTEPIGIMQAAGRILASSVVSRRSNPPAANAAVDGYAFAWKSLADGHGRLELIDGRAAAGHPFSSVVPPSKAIRILTGAEIPAGTDTVVLQEDCVVTEQFVAFPAPKKAGANVRPAGEDAREGQTIFEAGHRLTEADLARLASTGISDVSVRKRLRLAVLSTGDELIPPGASGPGIHDANRPMLLALGRAMGCDVVDLGIARDDAATVRERFEAAARAADVVMTTGGASTGDEDYVSRLLSTEGTISNWRISIKPGRPLALGVWHGIPFFGLPGNPVAAFVCALIFARPAISTLAGGGWLDPQAFTVPAAFTKRKKP